MVIANPPLAEPVIDPGGVTIKPPFEMGVANLEEVWLLSWQSTCYGGIAVWGKERGFYGTDKNQLSDRKILSEREI